MSEREKPNDANLVALGQRGLATAGDANPLVSRGLAEVKSFELVAGHLDEAIALFERGQSCLEKKQEEEARLDFEEAIRLLSYVIQHDTTNAIAYRYRAKCWRKWTHLFEEEENEDYDTAVTPFAEKAFQDFDDAIRLEPRNPHLFIERAEASWQLRVGPLATEKALDDLAQAMRLDLFDTAASSMRNRIMHEEALRARRVGAMDPYSFVKWLFNGDTLTPPPCALNVSIPGSLHLHFEGLSIGVGIETPTTIENRPTRLIQQALLKRQERLGLLISLNAPEIIIQHETRFCQSIQKALAEHGDRETSYWYSFDAESKDSRSEDVDESVASLACLAPMQLLDLSNNVVTNKGLMYASGFLNLLGLRLSNCKMISDDGLFHVSHLGRLEELHLNGCVITNAGLVHLYRLRKLRQLNLADCPNVTPEGIEALRSAIPQCDISFERVESN